MSRAKAVGAALAGLLVLFTFLPAETAASGKGPELRVYRGRTSQGQRMRIVTMTDDSGTWVETLHLGRGVTLSCEDGSETEGWWFDRGLKRREVPVSEGSFAYDNVSYWQATHVHGRIGSRGGSGILSDAQALLFPGGVQLCATGELTWEVESVVLAPARRPVALIRRPRLSGTRAVADGPDVRNYQGRTSQGERLWLTIGAGEGSEFLSLGFRRTLGCEDGTGLRWDWGQAFLGSTPSEPRLDLDVESGREVLHIDGRLSTHGGSGTLEEVAPALTVDEQAAQLCTTGELTWRLWRTDEGF